jgi:N-acetylglucosaminyldiphosphoundecaprenol N-acetyl-beta-D-mannosaminyltransferase
MILQRLISIKRGLNFIPVSYGPDLMIQVCIMAGIKKLNIGLIGCQSENELCELELQIRKHSPDLNITFKYSPPFQHVDEYDVASITENVTKAAVDILFVGLGAPKQNILMKRINQNCSFLSIGVGAAFDFNSGKARRSPKFIHNIGLEWLYRLFIDPKRLWKRVSTNLIFLISSYNKI